MKKLMKRIMPLVLIVAMCACLAAPAFAASGTPASVMGTFPSQSTSSYSAGYTKVVQRLMYVYNDTTRSYVVSGGGIDGGFGAKTKSAVVAFQTARGFTTDGVFGAQSWPWLGNVMYNYATTNFVQRWYGNYVIVSLGGTANGNVQSGTTWYVYKYNTLGNTGSNTSSSTYWQLFRTES